MDSIATSVLASLTSAAGYVPPPVITAAPDLKSHHRLALRQEEEEVTMNYCAVVNMQDGESTSCSGDGRDWERLTELVSQATSRPPAAVTA
jgi:hypothetical protein